MALFYKNQGYIERLSVKTAVASYRLSEQREILFGGEAKKYDELKYLRNQNTDANGVNNKFSDAFQKFGEANGVNTDRADQTFHDFTLLGTFP